MKTATIGVDRTNSSSDSSVQPGVEQLISTALPFSDGEDLLRRIVESWCKHFGLERLAIVWQVPFTFTSEVALRESDSHLHRFQIVFETCSSAINSSSFCTDERLASFRWQPLLVDAEVIGFLGCDESSELTPDKNWIDTTARLLSLKTTWDRTLNDSKLHALGEFAAGAGHEINNPLAAIRGRTEQLLAGEKDHGRRQLLETIGAQTLRIRDMIGDTMLFARPPEPVVAPFCLTELITEVMQQFVDDFSERKISLYGKRDDTDVVADRQQLAIALAELVRNAVCAVADHGTITIDCLTDSTTNDRILKISDDGVGFTDLERQHCFDPFFSGRQAGRGLGFGLSKAWRIVTNHGGLLTLSDSKQTEFVIQLPCPPE